MTDIVVDAYGERRAEAVMRDTWGHMDAEPGRRYPGNILFAASEFNGHGTIVISCDFGDAGYGPWFYEGINDWLVEQEVEEGNVYRFTGYYLLTKKGEHRFCGTIEHVKIDN